MPVYLIQRLLPALRASRGSAAVEYVGLALVVSSLMAAVATAIDSHAGQRLATAFVDRLLAVVSG